MPQNHVILISTDENGIIPPAPAHVKYGDTVRWRTDAGNMAIVFQGEGPFLLPYAGAPNGAPTLPNYVARARPGSHKYTILIETAHGTRVCDPEIIVNDGE
jgi:hypothetical protein